MSIVCSGSVAYDYLMRFPGYFRDQILPDHLDSISLSFLVDDMVRLQGGVAPNVCYSLALLGEKPILFAAVGEDFDQYRKWLEERGVDCRFARVIPGKFTASFFSNTDLANAQIASFYTGAMKNSADLKVSELKDEKVDLFLISPSDPDAMIGYARQCKELGIPFGFDPSQQIVRMNREMIREGLDGAKFLFCNEYEFELLKKHSEWSEEEVLDRVDCAVITFGEKGSRIYADGSVTTVPVYPPERIVDPTGVGDAYRSGFLTGYYKGLDWELCGKMGALASTYVLEQKGTQSHRYDRVTFIERFRKLWDDGGRLDCLL
ncbi:MAG TPA: carbohydrate kinase family protein [Flexilinea sp.]|nr:carbohydrate kinase family protein [Flexilinea sp.]